MYRWFFIKYNQYCFYTKCILILKIRLFGKIAHNFSDTISCKLKQREDFEMKKRLLSLCMALLLMVTALPLSVYAADEVEINETNFPNMNFRNYVCGFDIDNNGTLSAEEISAVYSINVRGCSIEDLKGVQYFTSLKILYCGGNQLNSLDVSNCTALTELNCSWNNLTSLDVSNHTALTSLDCGNNQLSDLGVSKCTALRELHCYNNQLDTLDVSNNIALTSLNCPDNKLSSLDLDKEMESLDVEAQTSNLEVQKISNGWVADLSKLVGTENLNKVEIKPEQGW